VGFRPSVAIAVLLAGLVAPVRSQVTFRSGIDLVRFGVAVVDKGGDLITDLREPDFEVYEDGKKQTLKYLIGGDATPAAAGPELHLGALLDMSGSMEEDLKLARSAVIKFLNTLTEAVDITLVDFDTEVRVARFGPEDFPRLVERVRSRKPEGYTALYDALGVYLDGSSSQEGRKILVLYSDGGDNRSNITFSEALDLLRASDVTVHAIGFLEHQLASTSMEQRMRLRQIAELTGGQAFFPTSAKELDGIYEKVQAEIRAQYVLGYESTNPRTDGAWRKVEIKVTHAGLKGVKVRTRRGYFAPYFPSPGATPRVPDRPNP
jgi:Ca-activated chloride channel homolog